MVESTEARDRSKTDSNSGLNWQNEQAFRVTENHEQRSKIQHWYLSTTCTYELDKPGAQEIPFVGIREFCSFERWKPVQKFEAKNAKTPNVHTGVMLFAFHCTQGTKITALFDPRWLSQRTTDPAVPLHSHSAGNVNARVVSYYASTPLTGMTAHRNTGRQNVSGNRSVQSKIYRHEEKNFASRIKRRCSYD